MKTGELILIDFVLLFLKLNFYVTDFLDKFLLYSSNTFIIVAGFVVMISINVQC
jgi:hypothetical protein